MKKKKPQLSFVLSEEVKESFLSFCESKMQNKSTVLEYLIIEYLKKEKK